MKLNLDSFICDFTSDTEMVAIFNLPDLRSFICKNHIKWTAFKPDFVNKQLNQFVFCTENKEWKEFVELIKLSSGTEIVLNEKPTPTNFDIINYYPCNEMVIKYIVFPEQSDRTFLEQSQKAINDAYLLKKLRDAIANPAEFEITDLDQLKLYWNKINFFEDEPQLPF